MKTGKATPRTRDELLREAAMYFAGKFFADDPGPPTASEFRAKEAEFLATLSAVPAPVGAETRGHDSVAMRQAQADFLSAETREGALELERWIEGAHPFISDSWEREGLSIEAASKAASDMLDRLRAIVSALPAAASASEGTGWTHTTRSDREKLAAAPAMTFTGAYEYVREDEARMDWLDDKQWPEGVWEAMGFDSRISSLRDAIDAARAVVPSPGTAAPKGEAT